MSLTAVNPRSPTSPRPLSPLSQEMLGLCCILDPNEGNDPQKYFTRAFDSYSRLPGKLPRMLATRTMMLSAVHQAACGNHQMTSNALMRAHFEVRRAGGARAYSADGLEGRDSRGNRAGRGEGYHKAPHQRAFQEFGIHHARRPMASLSRDAVIERDWEVPRRSPFIAFQEENGRAALLLEQAAYALLRLPTPAKRKFAFQMVRCIL